MGTEVRHWMGIRRFDGREVLAQGKTRDRLSIDFGRLTIHLLRRVSVLSLIVIERTRVPGVSVSLPRQILLDALASLSNESTIQITHKRKDCPVRSICTLLGLNAALEKWLRSDPSLQISILPAADVQTRVLGLGLFVSRPNEPKINDKGRPNNILEVFIPLSGCLMADRQSLKSLQ